jgi:hypothetical protein
MTWNRKQEWFHGSMQKLANMKISACVVTMVMEVVKFSRRGGGVTIGSKTTR